MRSSNLIGALVDACLDDERTLEQESRTVGPRRGEVLHALAGKRALFAGHLLRMTGDAHSAPAPWKELGREVGRSLRVALGGRTDGDAVAACRRSCRRTESRFDAALQLPMPSAVRAALVEERSHLDEDYESLVAIQY